MKREILFRAKTSGGDWHTGFYVQQPKDHGNYHRPPSYEKNHFIVSRQSISLPFVEIIPETLGQFTGRTDKNGRNIIEDQVVGCTAQGFGQVYWHSEKLMFALGYKSPDNEILFLREISPYDEVIGNIHDNPDLLKS